VAAPGAATAWPARAAGHHDGVQDALEAAAAVPSSPENLRADCELKTTASARWFAHHLRYVNVSPE